MIVAVSRVGARTGCSTRATLVLALCAVALLTSCNGPSGGGQGWTQVSSRPFSAISFADHQHGWGVKIGTPSIIMATTNSGRTWRVQSRADQQLTDVDFADVRRGWVVGWDSTILATTDGGVTWHRQVVPTADYFGVSFSDAVHGWAVGRCGVIVATTDGGAHWSTQEAPACRADAGVAALSLDDVTFVNAQDGWAVTEGDWVVRATDDGGRTWKTQMSVPNPSNGPAPSTPSRLAFADSRHGWALFDSTIYATSDGATWALERRSDDNSLRAIAFPTKTEGWAVGTDQTGKAAVIFATTDGGHGWHRQDRSGTPPLVAISALDSTHAWAVGAAVLAYRP